MDHLINLEGILNASIDYDPWPHKLVDNVLRPDVYEKFRKAAEDISKTEKDDLYYGDGIWPNEFIKLGMDETLAEDSATISDQLLTINQELLSQFPRHLESKIGYFGIPRFNYSLGKLNCHIHDEGTTKTMVLVVYLIPEQTNGTRLYNGPNPENFVKEIEWKPNRGMLMLPHPGVSWHSFIGNGLPRYTLNLYYEKMEALENFNQIELERKLWFYDMFGKDRLHVTI